MLMAHPALLSNLLERYETLAAAGSDPEVLRKRNDTAYTLCVATGSRDITTAIAAARRRIAEMPGAGLTGNRPGTGRAAV